MDAQDAKHLAYSDNLSVTTDLESGQETPNPATAPALSCVSVNKTFGDTKAVNNISLNVDDNELVVLVGPSGCGKSTLLRLAAGIIPIDSGEITLHGTVVDNARHMTPPEKRNVGLVFQDHALFPHLTVAENVAFGIRKESRTNKNEQVTKMLALVGLGLAATKYPHELSGGEQQRVALARALAPQPSLLLLDEPFASLDTNLRSQIRADVMSIIRQAELPAILVTHEQSEALSLGDKVVVMSSGNIVQTGTAHDVFHAPKTQFIGRFMGEADFLPVMVSGDEAVSELASVQSATIPHQPVMMFRPDDLEIVNDPDGTSTVVAAEFRGAAWSYTARLASGTEVTSTASHTDNYPIGATVSVRIRPDHSPVLVSSQ